MKYPFTVKSNGKWYSAGEEVPTAKTSEKVLADTPVSEEKEQQPKRNNKKSKAEV